MHHTKWPDGADLWGRRPLWKRTVGPCYKLQQPWCLALGRPNSTRQPDSDTSSTFEGVGIIEVRPVGIPWKFDDMVSPGYLVAERVQLPRLGKGTTLTAVICAEGVLVRMAWLPCVVHPHTVAPAF